MSSSADYPDTITVRLRASSSWKPISCAMISWIRATASMAAIRKTIRPDRVRGWRILPRAARFCPVYAWRDAGAGRHYSGNWTRTSKSSTRWPVNTASISCCTITSLRIPWVRLAACPAPQAAAKSATASWHGAPSARCCRQRRHFPVHHAHRVGDYRVQWLVLHGHGLRFVPVDDGCGRTVGACPISGYRHGADQGRRTFRRPVRHSGRRRSSW